MNLYALSVPGTAEQQDPMIPVQEPAHPELFPGLQELPFISERNLVFPEQEGAEQCFSQAATCTAYTARTKRSAEKDRMQEKR